MKRPTSLWVRISIILGFATGGFIGWMVTAISCQPGSCVGASAGVGVVSGIVTALGVGVVTTLAVRSLAEWNVATDAGLDPPAPGCETGDDA
jgi:hypothetical protein